MKKKVNFNLIKTNFKLLIIKKKKLKKIDKI